MSRVLVVSRTRMNQGRVCVGGHDLDRDFRSLRLLTKNGMNLQEDDGIAIGEIWELDYKDHPDPDPPHIEDVLVQEGNRVETLSLDEVRDLILRNETPWNGSPEEIFDGRTAGTANGRVYVTEEEPLPSRSTGYWTPDADLVKHIYFDKPRYLYTGESDLNAFTWAGMEEPPNHIAAGALIRVSLARWHSFDSAPSGYYTQVSGIF